MPHQKHTKLSRAKKETRDIGIVGSNCNTIKKLFLSLNEKLKDKYNLAFVNADHAGKKQVAPLYDKELYNKHSHYQLNLTGEVPDVLRNTFFNETDLILINGNHQKSSHQLVIIDPEKGAALEKRKDKLSNVIALIEVGDTTEEYSEDIQTLIPNYKRVPVFKYSNSDEVAQFLEEYIQKQIPNVNGLILGGGKSSRMGSDKLFINYHGVPQIQYLQNILSPFCEDIFISCRADQAHQFKNALEDAFLHLGAYGGILSAFQKNPNQAWFSIACDIPLVNTSTLQTLFKHRNPSKIATCFYNSATGFPEPLITIWEPKAYPVLLHYLAQGYSCARKVLINSDVEIVKLQDDKVLLNANSEEEKATAFTILSQN